MQKKKGAILIIQLYLMLVVKLLVTEKQDWEYFRQIVVSLYIENIVIN